MTFVAQSGEDVVPGVEVVATLRHQVLLDSSELLDLPLLSVDTVVCQNNCSGTCQCVCHKIRIELEEEKMEKED